MKKQQLILAYYTFFASIALFLWSLFFTPKPFGFVLTALFTPVSLYFFLMISGVFKNHNEPSENHPKEHLKLPVIILITLFISSVSIFAYSTISSRESSSETAKILTLSEQIKSLKKELTDQNKISNAQIGLELKKVKDQLSSMKSGQKPVEEAVVMGELTSQVGTLTVKDKQYQTVNVYREKTLSSEVIGKAVFGKNYTYIKKDQDWYLILLDNNEGFISSQFIKEVQY